MSRSTEPSERATGATSASKSKLLLAPLWRLSAKTAHNAALIDPYRFQRDRAMPNNPLPTEMEQASESLLLGGRVRLLQFSSGYRAGMDAALLAAASGGEGRRAAPQRRDAARVRASYRSRREPQTRG